MNISKSYKILSTLLFILVGLAFIMPQKTSACEIDFEIIKNKKKVYNTSDVFIAKTTVTLTHRVCPVSIKKTKFKSVGLKILGATKWKQVSAMKYTRSLKVKVTGTKNGKVFINAVRTCDKEGGSGSLVLKSVPLKSSK